MKCTLLFQHFLLIMMVCFFYFLMQSCMVCTVFPNKGSIIYTTKADKQFILGDKRLKSEILVKTYFCEQNEWVIPKYPHF
jgi:hypothetical protein